MKLEDFIIRNVLDYPSLFKKETLRETKIQVLNHAFFTNGNGYDWAKCKNECDGGYLIEPINYECKKTFEWIRVLDKPYGVKTITEEERSYFYSLFKRKFPHDDLREFKEFKPYPISEFSKIYQIFIGEFVQEDWLQGAIYLVELILEIVDKNGYHHLSHNKNVNTDNTNEVIKFLNMFLQKFSKKHVDYDFSAMYMEHYSITSSYPQIIVDLKNPILDINDLLLIC